MVLSQKELLGRRHRHSADAVARCRRLQQVAALSFSREGDLYGHGPLAIAFLQAHLYGCQFGCPHASARKSGLLLGRLVRTSYHSSRLGQFFITMRVGVNCFLLQPHIGGLRQYFLALFDWLLENDRGNEYTFFYFQQNVNDLAALRSDVWTRNAI